MGKITGLESVQEVPSKVLLLYEAVEQLIAEGADIKDIRVSTITDRAGIGKGTAYDYFDSKEEILACAVIFYMRKAAEELSDALSTCGYFADQVKFLLEEIERGSAKQQCLINYIHVITDTSGFSRLVKEKLQVHNIKRHLLLGVYTDMVEKAVERGEVRSDLPIEYMVYVLFSKIMFFMICIGEDSIMNFDEKNIRPFVYQGILDELCEKKV